jgi:pimeloyl-ACP methyl ester carboxylesterase
MRPTTLVDPAHSSAPRAATSRSGAAASARLPALALACLLPALAAGSSPAAEALEPWRSTPLPPPLPAPAAQGVVVHDGARLAWSSFGAGPQVLVLLHGGAGNSEHWGFQVPALAEGRRVLLVDSRGHGRSTRDDQPFSYHQLAEDLVAVLDALHLDRVDLLGWSDGGIVGLDLALHHPQRLRKLAITGANFDLSGMRSGGGREPTFRAYFARCEQDYRRLSPTPEGYGRFLAALGAMWRTQPSYPVEALRQVPVPTLVMDGDHDEIVKAEHLRTLAGLLPHGQLALLPGASHFVLWQAPAAFNQRVIDFLDR